MGSYTGKYISAFVGRYLGGTAATIVSSNGVIVLPVGVMFTPAVLVLTGRTPGTAYSATSSVAGDLVQPGTAAADGVAQLRWLPTVMAGTLHVAGSDGSAFDVPYAMPSTYVLRGT